MTNYGLTICAILKSSLRSNGTHRLDLGVSLYFPASNSFNDVIRFVYQSTKGLNLSVFLHLPLTESTASKRLFKLTSLAIRFGSLTNETVWNCKSQNYNIFRLNPQKR